MYKIQVVNDDNISLNGIAADPAQHPITLEPGNNWIGFIGTESMDINQALANLNPTNSDVIKRNDAYAIYISGHWIGTLHTFEPGMGYNYFSRATTNKTFTFTSSK